MGGGAFGGGSGSLLPTAPHPTELGLLAINEKYVLNAAMNDGKTSAGCVKYLEEKTPRPKRPSLLF